MAFIPRLPTLSQSQSLTNHPDYQGTPSVSVKSARTQHSATAQRQCNRALAKLSCWLLVVILGVPLAAQTQVPRKYFGMQMHSGVITRQPWPVVSFGTMRLWDAGVQWHDINTAPGVYDWTKLDLWLADAKAHDADVLYAFARTPQWASSNPYDPSCGEGPGLCDPPNDLNADGTGSDQHWQDFVTAIVTHSKNSSNAHIQYWELWNEAYNPLSWSGTIPQMIRMSRDATRIIKSIDPTAVILSPSVDIEGSKGRNWLTSYLAAGGGQYFDRVAFHGYVQKAGMGYPVPENILDYISMTRTILNAYGQGGKGLWDTEASWGKPSLSDFTDLDLQAAFLARFYFVHRAAGVRRFLWYQWNQNTTGAGTLWIPDPNVPSAPGTVLKPGVAYAQVYDWMVGANLNGCSSSGTIWTCQLSRSGGYVAEAIWDTSQTCANGSCTTVGYTVDPQYVRYRALDGSITSITGFMVPVGTKPILLENGSPR